MIADFDNVPGLTTALLQWRSRAAFPTDLSSADLLGLSRELRQRSVFSARLTNARAVNELAQIVDDLLSGKYALSEGRWRMMKALKTLGYTPETGFPQDMANVPPAERDSLRDLSSEGRINLMLETNLRVAANYGRVVAGNTDYALHAYPAWELLRIYVRSVPRGSEKSHSAGWEPRWEDAAESVDWEGVADLSSRMIARKDSPIWPALGDGAGGFEDTLGNPFPPFAFNSGLGWRAVDRAECDTLGLLVNDEASAPMDAELSPGEQEINEAFDRLSPALQAALRKELAA